MAGALVIVFLLRGFIQKIRKTGRRQVELRKDLNASLVDVLLSFKPLKAMDREEHAGYILRKKTYGLQRVQQKQIMTQGLMKALQEPLATLFLAVGIYVTLILWQMPFSSLLVLLLLIGRVIKQLIKIQEHYTQLAIQEPGYWSFQATLRDLKANREKTSGSKTPVLNRAITFAQVNFSYGDKCVLKNLNLSFPVGRITAYLILPHMIEKKMGHIVNIASMAAKCGGPYAVTYDATKAGLAEWAQGLRLELANTGVHFSTIFPGYITEVGMFARFGLAPPRAIGSCTPAQVANAVVKALEPNTLEVIVNSTPQRLFYALKELSPSFGDWLLYKIGAVDFQRKKVGL